MKLLLYILLTGCPVFLFAQQPATLLFTDAKTKEPVEGVTVEIRNTKRFYHAGANGSITLPAVQQTAPVKIIFFALGYKTDSLVLASAGNTPIALTPDPLNLKEVTVLASSMGQKPLNLVSKIDLKLRPVKSSQELMQLVPGLFIAQHQGGGKAEQIFLRGFDIDHGTDIAISSDGIPVNMVSHAHGQGYADMHFLIPELVKQIDFGAGLYQPQYGNLSTAGYVNFETYDRLPENKVQAEAGFFDTYRALAMVQLPVKRTKQNGYFAGEYVYSNGPFKSPQHFNRFNFFAKYNAQVSRSGTLSIAASAFTSKWDASGQIPGRAVASGMIDRFGAIDDDEGGNTRRTQLNLVLKNNYRRGAALKNQLYYVNYHFDLFSNFTFFLDDPVNGDQLRQREQRNILGYNGSWIKNGYTKSGSTTTTAGWGVRADMTNGSELSHTKLRSVTLQQVQLGNVRETNYFLYLNETLNRGKWQFSAGSRFDGFVFGYNDKLNDRQLRNTQAIVSPKISVDYRYNKNLLFFVKAGKGFHSNDSRVATGGITTHILPAAWGADAGITLKPLPGMILTTSAWYLYLQQEFVYVGDGGGVEPGGRTQRKGIDAAIRYQVTPKIFAGINVNRAFSKDIDADKEENLIPLAPRFTATGSLHYYHDKHFSAGIYCRHMGDRPANGNYSITAPGYTVFDLAISKRIKKWELGVAVENLLNTTWNEAQFETTSQLQNEPAPVTELHFTPGTPFSLKFRIAFIF